MFDQAVNSMVCAASGAGDSMQGIEVSAVSHAPKMLYYHKMSQKMEIMSNIQPNYQMAPGQRTQGAREHPLDPSTALQSRAGVHVEHLWEHLREKQFPNLACSSLDEVIDKVCEGLTQLEADPKRLRSMTYFPHFRNTS
jgi:hypothetical protein